MNLYPIHQCIKINQISKCCFFLEDIQILIGFYALTFREKQKISLASSLVPIWNASTFLQALQTVLSILEKKVRDFSALFGLYIYFLTFPACFWIPIIFSNLNSNCSNFYKIWETSRNKLKRHHQKLFWPFTVRTNCSSDLEKILKFEAEGREFAKNFLDH